MVNNYTANDIPLDGMWADLDYLQDYKMFTLSDQYQDLGDKIKTFKEKGVKFVPILNPGIAVVP